MHLLILFLTLPTIGLPNAQRSKDVYNFSRKPASELLSVTCHMGSHSVICTLHR